MKVLIAIDGSPCSDAAIAEVGGRPWPEATEMRVITVDPPLGGSMVSAATFSAYDEYVGRERRRAEEALESSTATLKKLAPTLSVTSALLEGSPKERVVAEARRWGADLIVVGSSGRGAVRSFLLGSVSLAVALAAKCSVLIVRMPEPTAIDDEPSKHD